MAKRRTKAEMEQARYNAEVDLYQFFIYVGDEDKVATGFEFKEDALELLPDYEDCNAKVLSRKQLKSKGINVNEILTYWKSL